MASIGRADDDEGQRVRPPWRDKSRLIIRQLDAGRADNKLVRGSSLRPNGSVVRSKGRNGEALRKAAGYRASISPGDKVDILDWSKAIKRS